MEGQLKIGASLTGQSGEQYKIIKLLGAGGQGEVYSVDCNGKSCALKWYFPKMATKEQKDILENLVMKGSPDPCFLWPQDIVLDTTGKSFGYIMPLRPKNYKSIVDLMKRRADPSFYALSKAAYNLTKGYQKLHKMGFSYRDISFGNMFFDPKTGDVLICDNDNVAPNDNSCSVYGTPRFMAPEIVVGKAKPSRNTDQFSLAVLLFYMFMIGHPLEGKLEADIKCMDTPAMNKLYGTNPIFIFDPVNDSNRPVKGYQDNPMIYWEIYPKALKDLFTVSFTDGLNDPGKRITENEWLKVFANMMTGIQECPKCTAEVFYDLSKAESGAPHICWNCKEKVPMPAVLSIEKSLVLLNPNARIFSHDINGDYNMETVVASVSRNPKDPSILGIHNETDENWTYIKSDGTQQAVAPGRNAPVISGAKIDFGKKTGCFIKNQ